MLKEPIIIKDWNKGMGDSPHVGFGLLQNVEIDALSGAVRVGKIPLTRFHVSYTSTFTAVAATDVCTGSAPMPTTGTAVYVSNSGGALPAGLAASTVYFIINVSNTTFKLATTIANANAGTAINITDAGTGTQTVTSVQPATINHYARDPRTGTTFCIDSNGRVWYDTGSRFLLIVNAALDTGSGQLTNAAGNGLAVFRVSDGSATYLFAYRNALIDVINVFGTSNLETPVWSNAWKTMNSGAGSGNSHHSIVGQDNIVYFTDDRYIGSILEKAGSVFDPATAGTYTFNNQALDLPLGSLTYWLEQLGINLMISVSNDSFIYPWDRSSDSFGLPIPVGEYGVNKMKNMGNILYILAGTRGNIYWSQGTYVRPLKTIPLYSTNTSLSPVSNPVTWGGIASENGKLLVGVGAVSGNSGVYMLNVSSGIATVDVNAITIDNYPSAGVKNVTAILALNEFYQMGYAGGADVMDTSRYTSLGAVVIQSPYYRVGNKTSKAKISQIEVQLAIPQSGHFRLSYRTSLGAAFTTIVDPDSSQSTFITNTNTSSYQCDVGLIDLENIQIQMEMDGNLDLMEVHLNP